MNSRQADFLSWGLICVPLLLAAWLWPTLPDPMPSHWNASGEVDGYLPKVWGVTLMPLMAVGTWLIMKIIPFISPKGFRTEGFNDVIQIFKVTLVAFMALVAVLVLLESIGIDAHIEQIILAASGALLIVIGNFMGKVRKNFFIGIRTPWTLASDEVWSRTHRLGGRLFVLAGIVMMVGGLFKLPMEWVIGVVVVAGVYPLLHSFLLYRRIEGFDADDPENPSNEAP